MRFLFFLYLLGFGALTSIYSQEIEGNVVNEKGEPLVGITIVKVGENVGVISDLEGKFSISITKDTKIVFSGLSYETDTLLVKYSEGKQEVRVVMKEKASLLNEVVLTAKSESRLVREQAYAVEVLEARGFKNLSTNANSLLTRISGVNVRESGGLGSDFSVSLNGLSGNQIRIFLNGVPMDYFGSSLSLNNFSANIIERVEVYKGVVPVHLSSDALGGAINVLTNQNLKNYLDASYSFGSFNTHISTLNGQFRSKRSGFTNRFKSFYNYSENDYKVPVRLVNFETGKQDETDTWVRRFHDGYRSRMFWYETGFTGTKYADEIMIGILYSDNHKELQQPTNAIGQAKIPYGEVTNEEQKTIGNFTYSKKGFLLDRLSLNAYGVLVFSESIATDTASVRYDWFGESFSKLNNTTGEVENRKTLFTLNSNNYLANINAEYALTETQSLTVNYSLNDFNLIGSDPYKAQNNTQFSQPNHLTKQVIASSYTSTFLDKRLKATLFGKYYDYSVKSLETNYSGTELIPFSNEKSYFGFGSSNSMKLKEFQFKLSYERAIRFPEVVELFGDGLNIVASPTILPESSNNYNLGILYNKNLGQDKVLLSLNTFVRDAKNFIIPVVQGIKVYHINNGQVLSRGIDLSVGYNLREHLVFSFNGTYTDLRNNNKWRNGQVGLENPLYKARIPNVPYLFGNLSASYRNRKLFRNDDNYSVSINQSYVNSFYYRWESLASSNKSVVPRQYSVNLDFVYSMLDERYNFSFSIVNLFDSKLYDNFQQLRPGRNFNFKFRYFLN